jgi:hypothetical protein
MWTSIIPGLFVAVLLFAVQLRALNYRLSRIELVKLPPPRRWLRWKSLQDKINRGEFEEDSQ